jgi:hypothetical protein
MAISRLTGKISIWFKSAIHVLDTSMSRSGSTKDDTEQSHQVVWRCLDTEGHDTCLFSKVGDEWVLTGTAIFKLEQDDAKLDYSVICDEFWSSRSARVRGQVGSRQIDFTILKTADNGWQVNNSLVAELDGLEDIDLGFTPATNTNAIKRLNLRSGSLGETRAIWLDNNDWTFKPLLQAYHRHSEFSYTYISPSNDYQTDLQVDDFGIIRLYPELWQAI